jgi:isopentenyl diphosphate isomerase/L-lactate dehydrogenase-like FMN-dependent dehydrogenase
MKDGSYMDVTEDRQRAQTSAMQGALVHLGLAGGRVSWRYPTHIRTVADARALARRRVPRAVFDYLDGAAEGERSMRANVAALDAVQFRPRVGATRGRDPSPSVRTVLGIPVSLPVLLSPVGSSRSMHVRGDVAGARAAGSAGTIFTVSTMSGHTMEEIATEADGPLWFQLYFLGGRSGAERLVDRARRAGYHAIVVTLDTQSPGPRERELRHGLSPPIEVNLPTIRKMARQVVARPQWLAAAAREGFPFGFANATDIGDPGRPVTVAEALAEWQSAPARWEDLGWIRERFGGPVIAKGILTREDARRAIEAGASAIVVSNHGGRQLDRAPATMPALVEVLDAVDGQVEVYVDGGFRRGSDAVAAIALGARAVMIGRPWAYGLAAAGEPGVASILNIFQAGVTRTLRLIGCPSLDVLDSDFVRIPADW